MHDPLLIYYSWWHYWSTPLLSWNTCSPATLHIFCSRSGLLSSHGAILYSPSGLLSSQAAILYSPSGLLSSQAAILYSPSGLLSSQAAILYFFADCFAALRLYSALLQLCSAPLQLCYDALLWCSAMMFIPFTCALIYSSAALLYSLASLLWSIPILPQLYSIYLLLCLLPCCILCHSGNPLLSSTLLPCFSALIYYHARTLYPISLLLCSTLLPAALLCSPAACSATATMVIFPSLLRVSSALLMLYSITLLFCSDLLQCSLNSIFCS